MAVPEAMKGKYEAIAKWIEPFCDTHLNDEYKVLCLKALEKLCRKRPSPLLSGREYTWAAAIVYAIGQANFIFDRSQPIHMTADELTAPFGVSKTTAGSKAAEVRKMLKINWSNPEWVLESDLENHSAVWMVMVNGFIVDARHLPLEVQIECAARGLIPYVPALKGK